MCVFAVPKTTEPLIKVSAVPPVGLQICLLRVDVKIMAGLLRILAP